MSIKELELSEKEVGKRLEHIVKKSRMPLSKQEKLFFDTQVRPKYKEDLIMLLAFYWLAKWYRETGSSVLGKVELFRVLKLLKEEEGDALDFWSKYFDWRRRAALNSNAYLLSAYLVIFVFYKTKKITSLDALGACPDGQCKIALYLIRRGLRDAYLRQVLERGPLDVCDQL